jgi:predicted anti-sigma-YlaC factor YlaD
MGMLAVTQPEELSCDEVFKLLDEFAEAVLAGKAATGLMAMIEQHLQVCPDCRQEYETLLAMMKTP